MTIHSSVSGSATTRSLALRSNQTFLTDVSSLHGHISSSMAGVSPSSFSSRSHPAFFNKCKQITCPFSAAAWFSCPSTVVAVHMAILSSHVQGFTIHLLALGHTHLPIRRKQTTWPYLAALCAGAPSHLPRCIQIPSTNANTYMALLSRYIGV